MQTVDEWAEIRRLRFTEQLGIKAIAQRLDVTVIGGIDEVLGFPPNRGGSRLVD